MAVAPGRDFFITSRFVAGIGVGMASMLSPMYIAEIVPAKHRGRMVAINQLTIVLGILITNLVNYSLRNTGDDAWRWMFGLGVIPSLLFFAGVLWLPESPRWLVQNGDFQEASKILAKIGGIDFSNTTIAGIQKSVQPVKRIKHNAIFEKNVLPAVLVGIGLALFQQLCGINVVFNYTAAIFESIGASKDDQLLQTVFIGGVNLVFTLLAMGFVDKVGRKPLMLAGAAGLAVLYLFISHLLGTRSSSVSWLLLAAIGTYALTLAPVTWILISEIFPNKVRVAATSIAVIALWTAYFVLTFTFPVLYHRLQDKTFYVYAAICVAGFVFVLRKVKETTGKTLEEMETVFSPH
jgi:SP family xylose:H+ symportor-like MFS transporter